MRIWIVFSVVAAVHRVPVPAANLADFSDYSLRNSSGQVILPGRLFVPPEAMIDPTTPRPLMLYLHGGGARGANNTAQIEQAPDFMLDEAKRRAAFLYVPQTAGIWTSTSELDSLMTMIDRTVAERNADTNRVYATGYSNGGGGTWSLLSRNPHRFAAAIAVAGINPAAGFSPSNLLGTAIFALHARDDATIPVVRTRTVVNGILSAAGEPVPNYATAGASSYFLVSNPEVAFHRAVVESEPPGSTINYFISRRDLDLMYFETPNGGHTGLFGVFYDSSVYGWMFDHSLATPEPASALLLTSGLSVMALRHRRR